MLVILHNEQIVCHGAMLTAPTRALHEPLFVANMRPQRENTLKTQTEKTTRQSEKNAFSLGNRLFLQ
jgi:hypothetical protein